MDKRIPAEAFPPGEFLKEEMQARGWTVDTVAERLGWTPLQVERFLEGRSRLTDYHPMAHQLAAVVGTSPGFWLRLDAAWQEWRQARDSDGYGKHRRGDDTRGEYPAASSSLSDLWASVDL